MWCCLFGLGARTAWTTGSSIRCSSPRSTPPCFFCSRTAATEIYTLSLHDALPIFDKEEEALEVGEPVAGECRQLVRLGIGDRKSTRLNSSHANSSYAVFCLKKKTNAQYPPPARQGNPHRRLGRRSHPPTRPGASHQ